MEMISECQQLTFETATFTQADNVYYINLACTEHLGKVSQAVYSKSSDPIILKGYDAKEEVEPTDKEPVRGHKAEGLQNKKSEEDTNTYTDEAFVHDTPRDTITPLAPKSLLFYTAEDNASKKLRRKINIVLTLTPPAENDQKTCPAIVWKIMGFEKSSAVRETIKWSNKYGFCSLKEEDNGTLVPDLKVQVNLGCLAVLEDDMFQDSLRAGPSSNSEIGISTKQGSYQRFALCVIDHEKHPADRFSPVMEINLITHAFQQDNITVLGIIRGYFQCGPPVMLQAYLSDPSKFPTPKERCHVDVSKMTPLFKRHLDIRELSQNTVFRIYSEEGGKITLERI